MKIRTVNDLEDLLNSDLAWRKKEISTFEIAIKRKETYLCRAFISVLYAHWEGFVKSSAVHYLHFVLTQGRYSKELKNIFTVHHFRKSLKAITNDDLAKVALLLEIAKDQLEKRPVYKPKDIIDTESNLNFRVLLGILEATGIETAPFLPYKTFLDAGFVKIRNEISHGESTSPSPSDVLLKCNTVLELMETIKTSILNEASQRRYLRPLTPPPNPSPPADSQ